MKKILVALLMVSLILSGCNGVNKKNDPHILSKLASTPKEMFPGMKFDIPDPDDGDYYMYNVYGTSATDFSNYVEFCKDQGFTLAEWESDDSYGAYTEDGEYWIETYSQVTKEGVPCIFVCCNKSNNNPVKEKTE